MPNARRKPIREAQFHEVYIIATDIYKGQKTIEDGVEHLVKNAGMNESSAKIYIAFFIQLKQGGLYKNKMKANNIAIRYFLEKISDDCGEDGLRTALISLWNWIKYYEGLPNAGMIELDRVKDIHAEFFAKLK